MTSQIIERLCITPAKIKTASRNLCAETPYISAGPVFALESALVLSSLRVDAESDYDNFGMLDRLQDDLRVFFGEIGNIPNHAEKAAAMIHAAIETCLAALGEKTAWITVRASNPTDRFNVPRWHIDGYYFSPFDGKAQKLVLTLKGPGTRFANLPEETKERSKLILRGVPSSLCCQAGAQELYLYVVGADYAAVHSEPAIHDDRIFLSIVPGSTAQIEELCFRWNAKTSTYV